MSDSQWYPLFLYWIQSKEDLVVFCRKETENLVIINFPVKGLKNLIVN